MGDIATTGLGSVRFSDLQTSRCQFGAEVFLSNCRRSGKNFEQHPLPEFGKIGVSRQDHLSKDGLIAAVIFRGVYFASCEKVDGDTLLARLARANDQVGQLREQSQALVVFQGPHAYITPSWYVTKQEHGKVVPTWNYVIVQARGTPVVIEDPDWLRSQIDDLT